MGIIDNGKWVIDNRLSKVVGSEKSSGIGHRFNRVEGKRRWWISHASIEIKTQLTFTCLKSTIETLERGVKYVQS